MLNIALATLRTRWNGFAGSLLALALGVSVIATMALVLTAATDGDPHRRPQRFAAAPAVIQAEPALHVRDRYGSAETVPFAEQLTLPASVVARFPGAAADRSFYAQLPGGPPDQVGHGWSSAAFAPYTLATGHAPDSDQQIVVTGDARLGSDVGVRTESGTRRCTVAGTVRPPASGAGGEHAIFFSDAEAARLSPRVDALVTNDPASVRRAAAIPGVRVLTGQARHLADPHALQDRADLTGLVAFLGVAAMLSGFVSLYVTASTFGLSVAQRRRDLALLRTIGATPGQVIRMVCAEAALVGVAGSAAGSALGLAGGPLLAGWMARHGLAPAWFTVRLTGGSFAAVAVAFLVGLTLAVLSVTVASVRAGMIRPAEALREAAVDRKETGRARGLSGLGSLLCGIAFLVVLVVFFPDGAADLKNDVTLALLLLGGTALLLPALLRPLVRLMTWPFTRRAAAGGMLIQAGVLTGARRASAAVAPVLITVGLAAMVLGSADTANAARSSALRRQAGTADYVVVPSGTPGLTAPLVIRIHAIGGVAATAVTETSVLAYEPPITVMHLEAPMPIPFSAMGVDSPAALRLPVREGSLTGLNDRTVAVDTSWHKHVGDTMSLWLADGTPVTLRVAAVLGSGLGGGMVLSPRNAGRSLPSRMYVRLRPGAGRAATTAALLAAARTAGATIVPTARWTAAVSDRQAEQTRLGLIVLLGIAIAYSGIGIAGTFLMSVGGRKQELALLRLSGASRGQVLRVVTGESLLLALAGVVLAAGVSALLLAGLDTAFGGLAGTTPIVLPWAFTGAVAAGGVLTALVFSALPAWRILRSGVSV